MRRIQRIARSADFLRDPPRRVPYASTLCSACQCRAAPRSTAAFSTSSPRHNGQYTDLEPHEAETMEDEPEPEPYVPAKTWSGLPMVGGAKWAMKQELAQQPEFTEAFLPRHKANEDIKFVAALDRALIEVFQAKLDGKPLSELKFEDNLVDPQVESEIKAAENIHGVEITVKAAKKSRTPKQYDMAWRAISLRNNKVKFAVVKRVMQLTGIRIPDPAVANAENVGSLLNAIRFRPQKPKRTAELLESQDILRRLPNVSVSPKKMDGYHKEKQLGRWKVIRERLVERGLPVKL